MKATCHDTTPPPLAHRGAILDLEPSICEAALMSGIAMQLAEDLLSEHNSIKRASPEQCERVLFAAMQAHRMIEAAKAEYYAALKKSA